MKDKLVLNTILPAILKDFWVPMVPFEPPVLNNLNFPTSIPLKCFQSCYVVCIADADGFNFPRILECYQCPPSCYSSR